MTQQRIELGDTNEIRRLVDGFARNIKDLRDPGTKEATIRQEYINPFWMALGWDVTNTQQKSPIEQDVIVEANVGDVESEGLRTRRPDYIFRVNMFPRFVVEAKKPSGDLTSDKEAIFQAKRYAWSAQIPFAVLTDFQRFRLFDCTLKPYFEEPTRGLVEEFDIHYSDYQAQWDVLQATFGRDAVAGGSLESLLLRIKKLKAGRRVRGVDRMLIELRGTEPVGRSFLAELEGYRKRFARALYIENRSEFPDTETRHGAAKLTEAAQRLMDRLVFLRVCEDRNIEAWGALRETVNRCSQEHTDLYTGLVGIFRTLDAQYNGYLFKPHFTEQLKVPAELLRDFIAGFYPPESAYNFEAIGDDLLGIVYERFLGSVVTVKRGNVDVEQKPEVRHAGGVYYTPRFVVDAIIDRTIGPKIGGKAPADVLKVKVLDPACGSGSFLVAAYSYLMRHCLQDISRHPAHAEMADGPRAKKRRTLAFRSKDGTWQLTPEFKGMLLSSCIFGVDIDPQAVEVTVMSLYLKMLEGPMPQKVLWRERLLPDLVNNIRCGNSLISQLDFDPWWEEKNGNLFGGEDEARFRINAFDWKSHTRGFGRLLESHGGFDCIIGNPPYIRVQEMQRWAPDECEFYKWRYKSANAGNFDIYVVFIERALELLNSDGVLGYICPHKFWQAKYGAGLRKLIADGRHLKEVVDFTDQQVFEGGTTYTALTFLSKQPHTGKILYAAIFDLQEGDAQCKRLGEADRLTREDMRKFKAAHPVGDAPWALTDAQETAWRQAVESATETRLGNVTARMYQGIRTSMNEVFVLEKVPGRRDTYHSEFLGIDVGLEPGLLKPFLGGKDIRRYFLQPTSSVVIVPYKITRGGVSLLPHQKISKQYPATWAYLKRCEKPLRARERGRMDNDDWYGYVYPKNLDLFGEPRLVVCDIIQEASFALDEGGEAAFVTGYGITLKRQFRTRLKYVLGLLNSTLLSDFLKAISTTLRGGWFRPFPQFLERIPIKLPGTPKEERAAERIAKCVEHVVSAKAKLAVGGLSDHQREQLQRQTESWEEQINRLVCELYGLDQVAETGR